MISSLHHRTSTRRKATGFTLIELMIVIAIIALLAEILFPVFATARDNARRTSCMSNLMQLGLGVQQYVQDNDTTYPFVPNAPSFTTPPINFGWAYGIQAYTKSTQILHCPSDTAIQPGGATLEAAAQLPGFTDYFYNFNVGGTSTGGGVPESTLTYSSSTILSGDGNGASTLAADYWCEGPDPTGSVRHRSGGDYLFCDGHVKWLGPAVVLSSVAPSICTPHVGTTYVSQCGDGATPNNIPTGTNSTFCIF